MLLCKTGVLLKQNERELNLVDLRLQFVCCFSVLCDQIISVPCETNQITFFFIAISIGRGHAILLSNPLVSA